jgi:hypothetical protein
MRIQLSENQVKSLIKGYKYINEQETPLMGETRRWEVNFNALWDSGKWKLNQSHMESMKPELTKIVQYLRKHPNTKLNIQIVSGESKVPNYDREQSGNVKVPEGYLSQKRGDELKQKLEIFFKELNLENSVEIPKSETRIGGPSWTPQDNANDPKFKEHQFVKLVITGEYSIACLIGMTIEVSTLGLKDGHRCDEAIFEFKVNGISLGIVNLNNALIDVGQVKLTDDRLGDRLKQYISTHNNKVITRNYSAPLARQIFKKFESGGVARPLEGSVKSLPQYVWQNETLKDWGRKLGIKEKVDNVATLNDVFYQYWLINRPTEISNYIDLTNGESVIPEDLMVGSLQPYIGQTIDQIFNEPKVMLDKINNMDGRKTDGKVGGFRSQTFMLDTSKAQDIVNQTKTKDKLILSIKPLVSKTGPYRMFFSGEGSHTEVPRIKITGKEGDVRYEGMPNKSLQRGDLTETPILTTDICGNAITS